MKTKIKILIVSILMIGNQMYSQNTEIIKDGPVTYTKLEKHKLSNGDEYIVVENPGFDESNKIYKKEIKKVFEYLYPDAPNFLNVYIDTWKKYSSLKDMRYISVLNTFHAGRPADDYYNYFKDYDLMKKFMTPHFIYFDNNNIGNAGWEIFKKDVRNPQVEIMKKELTEALKSQKSKDLKENIALAKFVKGVFTYTSSVVKQMVEDFKNVDLSSSNQSSNPNNTSTSSSNTSSNSSQTKEVLFKVIKKNACAYDCSESYEYIVYVDNQKHSTRTLGKRQNGEWKTDCPGSVMGTEYICEGGDFFNAAKIHYEKFIGDKNNNYKIEF